MADSKVQTAGVYSVGKPRKTGEVKSEKNFLVDRACANPLFQAQLTKIAADPKAYETCMALFTSRMERDTYTGNSAGRDTMSAMKHKLARLREEFCLKEKGTTIPFETKSSVNLGNDNIFTSLA